MFPRSLAPLRTCALRFPSIQRTGFGRALRSPHTAHPIPLRTAVASQSIRPFSSTPHHQQIRYIRFNDPPPPHSNPHFRGSGGKRLRDDTRIHIAVVLGVVAGVYYIAHLEQVPETGRWRFMNTNPKFEAEYTTLARQQLLAELNPHTLPASHPISRHVRRVVTRILTANDLGSIRSSPSSPSSPPAIPSRPPFALSAGGFGEGEGEGVDRIGQPWDPKIGQALSEDPDRYKKEWDVIVVNDPNMVNAMASPGVVVVFTGILPVCQDEEGLAAVLAHEVGHVVARHTAERISSQTVFLTLQVILQVLGIDMGISNASTKFLLELPNSRAQELEADLIGLNLMAKACYDPEASPRMFTRLGQLEAKMSGGASSKFDFFNTHPSSESRVEAISDHLPSAYAILEANPECAAIRRDFDKFRDGMGVREVRVR